jgi:hypothetical protein
MHINKRITRNMSLTAIAAATSLLAACGGGGGSNSAAAAPDAPITSVQGVVADSVFVAGSAAEPQFLLTAYQNAQVCIDANNNGVCDAGENPVRTDANGSFTMPVPAAAPLIADIGTDATSIVDGKPVTQRNVFRVALDQVKEQSKALVISPLSAEVVRMMDANNSTYATEKQNLATRINVPVADVLGNPSTTVGTTLSAMLAEGYRLSERYAFAIKKLDRQDKYPDDLAVAGGDPRLNGLPGVSATTVNTAPDNRAPITFAESQQAAFNIEGVPRYDHIFIVMLENKATLSIKGSNYAPNINNYLNTGNQLTSYFATGNPSEPNYTALGGADDFGIVDDNAWNCDATGANAVQDPTLPPATTTDGTTVFTQTCTKNKANHNIVGRPNLFNALTSAGLTWRTYSESMNPGQDVRADSIADPAVIAKDNVYPANTINGVATQMGDPTLSLPMPAGLYKTKHHPGMAYQNVRVAPEFAYSNRTLGGGQWDASLTHAAKYAFPAGYNVDQFSADLASGNVGTVNFVVPDQCDDMHGISVPGTTSGGAAGVASDCSGVTNGNAPPKNDIGNNIIFRGDKYVKYLVDKIQQSPLWKNPQKRVAIVLMFDEGNATGGVNNSCCGWAPGSSATNPTNPLTNTGSVDTSVVQYASGNRGHGESIFGILTNTASSKGVADGDVYSHFSFVRTLQDMFALADPANDFSYMNRSKYTEKFIADHITDLPEYAGSADTHFDSVRPINHAFKAPAGYTQIQSPDVNTPAQVGPDLSQANVWALK